MRHLNKKHKKFNGKDKPHRRAMLRNLLTNLVTHKAINTTEKRAHALQEIVDRTFRIANTSDQLTAIRYVMAEVTTEAASKELFRVAPKYKETKGAVTRMTPFKFRDGDAAKLVRLELL